MKEIRLTQGKVAIVDDDDYERISQYKWYAGRDPKNGSYYATRSVVLQKEPKFKTKNFKMHREVLGIVDGKIHVDHKDGDTLNNTKENLRAATPSQNGQNRRKNKNNASGFRGVSFKKRTYVRVSNRNWDPPKQWVAQINVNGKRICLGYFYTPEEAALAFDKAAKEFYGEFCGKLNFE